MGILEKLRPLPRWKHADPAVRAASVYDLGPDEAEALLALARAPRRRYWTVGLPLVLYALWWLAKGGEGESDFAFANLDAAAALLQHADALPDHDQHQIVMVD